MIALSRAESLFSPRNPSACRSQPRLLNLTISEATFFAALPAASCVPRRDVCRCSPGRRSACAAARLGRTPTRYGWTRLLGEWLRCRRRRILRPKLSRTTPGTGLALQRTQQAAPSKEKEETSFATMAPPLATAQGELRQANQTRRRHPAATVLSVGRQTCPRPG